MNENTTIETATVEKNEEKPLVIGIEEMKRNLVTDINTLNMHPSVLKYVLKDIFNEILTELNMFEKSEVEQYTATVSENKDKE